MTRARPRSRRVAASNRSGSHIRTNRQMWERTSDAYEERHRRALRVADAASWGLFRIPESELHLIGNVRGLRVLELGCGAALWSLALAAEGALPVGLDFSSVHLRHARRNQLEQGRDFPLVEASAEHLPFDAGAFDLAFCDWGALTFADPLLTIPEAARVLVPGGRLVFSTASPLRSIVEPRSRYGLTPKLRYDYFGMHRLEYPREVNFNLPYGRWIELFRDSGLDVLRLVEPQAPTHSQTTYLNARDVQWAHRWPVEAIWVLGRSDRADAGPGARP